MFSIADLMSAVASRLVGGDLEVVFRDPSIKGADGCFYRIASGKQVIEMKPYLRDDRSLFVLLHECAHAVRHREREDNEDLRSSASGSVKINFDDVPKKREDEADQLANEWIAYAKRHQGEYYEQGMLNIEAQLWALLNKR